MSSEPQKRPPEPEVLKQWREWIKAGPPKVCHTCDHYTRYGNCMLYEMRPPDDFTAQVGACAGWQSDCPF